MGRREDLIRREAEAWARLTALLSAAPPDRLEQPGLNDQGWSVKDLSWHLAFWCADTARALREMREGTFDRDREPDGSAQVDPINDAELVRSRSMRAEDARAELFRAREEMLERFGELAELSPEADEWFEETGPLHYAEHLPALEAWIARLRESLRAREPTAEIPGRAAPRP